MKKVLFSMLVAVFGLTGSAYAQFNAGTISIGGAFSLSVEKEKEKAGSVTEEEDPITTFQLSPSVGYFLAEDLELGARIGFIRESQNDDDVKDVSQAFTFGPYARKYFSLGESTAFFGEAGLTVGGGKRKLKDDDTTYEPSSFSLFNIGITPGIVFMPSERLGVEFTAGFFGYSSTKNEVAPFFGSETTTYTESKFGLTVDMTTVQLGLKYYLQ